MATKSKISAYILRSSVGALLFSCVIVAVSSAIDLPCHLPNVPVPESSTAIGMNAQGSDVASIAAIG